jgi:hypothetical protein
VFEMPPPPRAGHHRRKVEGIRHTSQEVPQLPPYPTPGNSHLFLTRRKTLSTVPRFAREGAQNTQSHLNVD